MFDKSIISGDWHGTECCMSEISPKVEEFRERVRAKYPRRKEPNFRIPWYVLVVNMLLIAYILFIYGRKPAEDESGTTLQFNGAEYHLLVVREAGSDEKIASLTVRNLINTKNNLVFVNAIASLEFYHGKKLVASEKIGDGINSMAFNPGEFRTFVVSIPQGKLIEYAKSRNDLSARKKRSLISMEPDYVPFSARLTIHLRMPVASIFEYRVYGVK